MRVPTVIAAAVAVAALTQFGPAAAAQTPAPHTTLPPGLMAVPLAGGCNNVTLTYPEGTAIADFYHAVVPATAPGGDVRTPTPIVEAIWRYDAAAQRFLGWSPLPNAPSDFATVGRLDAVYVCVSEAGRLVQPALP